MPRPCAVETHARGYKERSAAFADATVLCRGDSRSRLQRKVSSVCGCHGLVPWRLTFIAKALRHYSPKASSVSLHGARPWHLGEGRSFICSRERESPRRKAVASGRVAQLYL